MHRIKNRDFKILVAVLIGTLSFASYNIHISPTLNPQPYSKLIIIYFLIIIIVYLSRII